MADETYDPQERPGMGLLQKLGGVTPNGMPHMGHPDDIILEPDEGPQEPVEAFVLRLDEREKPFYIEEDFYLRTRHGTQRVRIRSVDVQVMEGARDIIRPKRPTVTVRARNGELLSDEELQEKFPKYRTAMLRFNREIGYLYILYGTIGLTLTNKTGEEVWNTGMADKDPEIWQAELSGQGPKQSMGIALKLIYAKAFTALDGMGLSEPALIQWFQAINQISQAKEQESDEDFLAESDGNSGYL